MKKSLFRVFVINIFYMLVVAATNFVLPMVTSVETYAAVKEYTLYITTYASVLTFGYTQGVYLEYGGREVETLDPAEIGESVCSFLVLMLPASIILFVYGVIRANVVLSAVGVGLLSTNMNAYYQLFYQATGDFKSYGVALNTSRIALLLAYLFLALIVKTDHKVWFVCIAPAVGVLSALYLTWKLNQRIRFLSAFRFRFFQVQKNVRGGFILMLGNFVTSYFTSIDKWFVKYLMNTFSFAMYSFAVSMDHMVNTFMSPITVSMYNYFCKKPEVEKIKEIKDYTLIYSFVVIAAAFPCKWFVEQFVEEYTDACSVIFLLFAAQAISAIIRGVYVNKYKAEGQQKKYLRQMICMLVLAVVLNIVFYWITPEMTSIAAATLITNLVWLLICEIENPQIRYDWKSDVSIVWLLAVFCYGGSNLPAISGLIVYVVTGVLFGVILMRKSFFGLFKSVFAARGGIFDQNIH